LRLTYLTGRLGSIILTIGLILYVTSMIHIPFSHSEVAGSGTFFVDEAKVIFSDVISPMEKVSIRIHGFGLKVYIVTANPDARLDPILMGGTVNASKIKELIMQLNVVFEGDSPYSGEVDFSHNVRLIIVISNEVSGVATVNYVVKVTRMNIPIVRVRSTSINLILIGCVTSIPLVALKLKDKIYGGR